MVKQFWHDTITEKSWQTLKDIKGRFNFVLIGGWAVYLYTQKMKSKDIDIVVDYGELGKLKEEYQLNKNERLKKYEIELGDFDIDIYLPHYSRIGFPLEKLHKYAQELTGFIVPKIEVLLGLKLYAYLDRKNSVKGEKDKIDIVAMLDAVSVDWRLFSRFDKDGILVAEIKEILSQTNNIKELGINNQAMAKLRKRIFREAGMSAR